ncbi:recombinase family protein [Paraburkholderia terricola]|uniref:Site-specific DNA recombinase n=1 Tax=Paraburkholderia terricola TaxID=169427 RepID=A0A1M6Z6K8_9BURK|nr:MULTISPECIES: recombinase family protein [Paraburkholderia]SDP45602.1 Site-specific DNA recombinase [Paraburkholderia sediminicola]SHL26032.1 Site-specific DNA recombinase [Paraburkholderia terricola]
MNSKINSAHLGRDAVVYVRQSSPGQVHSHTESKRRQYDLAESARKTGFANVTVIDDDLGRSGSGLTERPGFQKLVAAICGGTVGAVFCIEASRLARNGRDWHHLVDLCALTGTLIIDPDGVHDPRLTNDRLLLGLKGSMSEYELSLLRERGIAARDAKAARGELRFSLPPGYCWNELGKIELDPDERVTETIRLVFRRFRELGSARQVFLWAKLEKLQLPVLRQSAVGNRIAWQSPAYHNVIKLLQHPVYAGAYVFGRKSSETHVVDGRARKGSARSKPMQSWNVLLKDHHPGYITWNEFEENQRMIAENAHMQKRMSRKSARGGRALLGGLVRCGRCGRMMRVFYGMRSGQAHRYQCRGDDSHVGAGLCIGIGGVRVDKAIATQLLEAVSTYAVDAAIRASETRSHADDEVRKALTREAEEARYEVSLAERRYEAVDPGKRLVARELEARWNAALERVAELQNRIEHLDTKLLVDPEIDRERLMLLAHDLPTAWNASGATPRTKQRIVRVLIQEVVIDLDDSSNEAVLAIHWTGGRHTEVRIARIRGGRYPDTEAQTQYGSVEVMRKLGGKWPDRDLAVTMNRMRCKSSDGKTWTTVRVRELRERLAIAAFDPASNDGELISVEETARRLQICVGSVHRLIDEGILPASQLMSCAPWQIPVASLSSEAVQIGVRGVIERRPRNFEALQDEKTLRLPGF